MAPLMGPKIKLKVLASMSKTLSIFICQLTLSIIGFQWYETLSYFSYCCDNMSWQEHAIGRVWLTFQGCSPSWWGVHSSGSLRQLLPLYSQSGSTEWAMDAGTWLSSSTFRNPCFGNAATHSGQVLPLYELWAAHWGPSLMSLAYVCWNVDTEEENLLQMGGGGKLRYQMIKNPG